MSRSFIGAVVIAGAMLLTSGCRDRDDGPKYHVVKGRVTSINLSSGEVAMKCYIPKQKVERDVTGKLAPEAEILINGSTAQLEDVRVDDQVEVKGYLQKRDDAEPLWVATKVEITRADAQTQPAAQTQPQAQ
jgi:hypothetical protein